MKNNYLTVTALTKYIKRKFETDPHLKNIWLKGEISNFKHHNRGHMYLTIKDNQTRIKAVMFAGYNRHLKFMPEDGMDVLIKGEIGVFEPQGQYQLYIHEMEPDGMGSLYLAFEQLKEKLQQKGYFNDTYKKNLPAYPEHIGIITSPTGAAVRDILTTIKRRYPIVKTTILPVLVQGSGAAESIKRAIEYANRTPEAYDVLIVGRGGGSIEELWSFNEEIVANAIYHSEIPIISAVGHETDFTISDFVSDKRAATPTGAAELAVPSQVELLERINTMKRSLTRMLTAIMTNSTNHLQRLNQSYAFRYPEQLVTRKEQELDKLVERLAKATESLVKERRQHVSNWQTRLHIQHPNKQLQQRETDLQRLKQQHQIIMTAILEQKQSELSSMLDKLTLLNPLEIMKRGYAIPYTEETKIIRSTQQVKVYDNIKVTLSDGDLYCHVDSIKEEKDGAKR
ncbi:exodeoxyribonuclease VII large subunit [Oceanobacillus halotolerans]|uniref:exodeoxyribonuclease VII large subunit n=1 Tax=Oceanobacillus halotolerans TaxID=2663380 RepID=UPI0013DBC125|nr:exodeoxyribonuclease VII large subunit [Oceanobacillus halotolerans]